MPFPEWTYVVFFKAFLDNVIYVLPPRLLLLLGCGLLIQLKVQPCIWIIAAFGLLVHSVLSPALLMLFTRKTRASFVVEM